jgi:hypothetical protein
MRDRNFQRHTQRKAGSATAEPLLKEGIQSDTNAAKHRRHKFGNSWVYEQDQGEDAARAQQRAGAAAKSSEEPGDFVIEKRQDEITHPCEDDSTYAGARRDCPTRGTGSAAGGSRRGGK